MLCALLLVRPLPPVRAILMLQALGSAAGDFVSGSVGPRARFDTARTDSIDSLTNWSISQVRKSRRVPEKKNHISDAMFPILSQ